MNKIYCPVCESIVNQAEGPYATKHSDLMDDLKEIRQEVLAVKNHVSCFEYLKAIDALGGVIYKLEKALLLNEVDVVPNRYKT